MRGTSGTLALLSAVPVGNGETEADVALGLDSSRRLVLRWTPHVPGHPFGPQLPSHEAELLRGVQGIAIAYWSAAEPAGWRASWSEATPPALVRLRVTFPGDDMRRWPDIVVAPMRQRLARNGRP